ncbi:hypothetical protein DRB05_16770 [Pseudoalteromonas sp. A757]|nr:hypothetical protein DRB05_16770 [Pseudoalteromonas sp. A757]
MLLHGFFVAEGFAIGANYSVYRQTFSYLPARQCDTCKFFTLRSRRDKANFKAGLLTLNSPATEAVQHTPLWE